LLSTGWFQEQIRA